ncbi:helix-turn-helix domain-containing protein [Actinomadura rubrisoli]|uniref:helix-turn-helix domain-containing protein n=1 Tax=Actinomadura rubrisoli TaxID=2530368 RepID=UPI0014052038|nr:helix-turn-helix transcriptional regulator [Actinomadura rubrisoli]
MTRDEIASALRKLREEAGLTGETVARRAGMSPGKLSKVENGRTKPTVQDVDRILTAIGVFGEVKDEFLNAARIAATEEKAWRLYRRLGLPKHQAEIRAIEVFPARLIRVVGHSRA